jgi:hypothetical protein
MLNEKATKYNYLKVIQQNYGQGWEDVSEYEATSTGNALELSDKPNPRTGRPEKLLNHDLREYKKTGYATRVIFRREANK